MRTGVVFDSDNKTISEVGVGDILKVAKPIGTWLKRVGIGMVVAAILGGYWVYEPLVNAEWSYRSKIQDTSFKMEEPNNPRIQEYKNTRIKDKDKSEYKIYIPKIGAEAIVIPDIDPFDKNVYSKALLEGVAEAKDLAHPGEIGTTYLFAHSVGSRVDFARYNAVFYLLNKLEKGDEIYIDYEGNNYTYRVDKKEILLASDLKYFEDQKKEEKLVLQTCYPPGTSWKRLVVVAIPKY